MRSGRYLLYAHSQSLQPGNSTVQYYLQLCSPLRLDGDCSESSNSTVSCWDTNSVALS